MMVLLQKEDIPAILLSIIGNYSLMLLYSLSAFSYRCKTLVYINVPVEFHNLMCDNFGLLALYSWDLASFSQIKNISFGLAGTASGYLMTTHWLQQLLCFVLESPCTVPWYATRWTNLVNLWEWLDLEVLVTWQWSLGRRLGWIWLFSALAHPRKRKL